jgi:hypothetical protein
VKGRERFFSLAPEHFNLYEKKDSRCIRMKEWFEHNSINYTAIVAPTLQH